MSVDEGNLQVMGVERYILTSVAIMVYKLSKNEFQDY